jgi:hypothetical protein
MANLLRIETLGDFLDTIPAAAPGGHPARSIDPDRTRITFTLILPVATARVGCAKTRKIPDLAR